MSLEPSYSIDLREGRREREHLLITNVLRLLKKYAQGAPLTLPTQDFSDDGSAKVHGAASNHLSLATSTAYRTYRCGTDMRVLVPGDVMRWSRRSSS